jgi:hypothetical protein
VQVLLIEEVPMAAKTSPTTPLTRRVLLRTVGSLLVGSGLGPWLGCATPHLSQLVPELDPVDRSRPRVRYRIIQGVSIGGGGLLAAILDLRRLTVDGYVDVVVDQSGSGEGMRTTVTAYPFTYGRLPQPISIRVGPDTGIDAPPEVDAPPELHTTREAIAPPADCAPEPPAAWSGAPFMARLHAQRRRRAGCRSRTSPNGR